MKRIALALFFVVFACCAAQAQSNARIQAQAVATCGGQSLTAGVFYPVTQDLTGTLCTGSGGGGGGTAVTIADGASVTLGAKADAACGTATGTCTEIALLKYLNAAVTDTTPIAVVVSPGTATSGVTPTVSTAAENSHILKAGAGVVYSVYATNLTTTDGYLQVFNAVSAPADGAVTPLACAPLSGGGVASIHYAPGPPGIYGTGITAVVSSAATCFTKTTGTITAFISGMVQ